MLFNPVSAALVAACASCALAHGTHDQTPVSGPHKSLWYNTLPGDGGTQVRDETRDPSTVLLRGVWKNSWTDELTHTNNR
jgi:hypothetical protein